MSEGIRIDKWLWAVRLVKTRSIATDLCKRGRVFIDGNAVKPSRQLQIGDQIIFEDMIHYTMVKSNMFNGVKHPDMAIWTKDDQLKIVRQFNYSDFKNRLS